MIVIDTHIWVRLILGTGRLSAAQRQAIADNEDDISEWFRESLTYPGLTILELTPEIAVESTRLPSGLNKDPSDQIIVATAEGTWVQPCDFG
ncbi:MAG: hypothetical protein OXC95_00625 [Dehalococcoidia bacterium]|nr:hypothetical protein [Dehalococcoidia bacterium]